VSIWAPVTHACNPSYSGGRDHEVRSSGQIVCKILFLKYSSKKGSWSGSRCRPWIQTSVLLKKKLVSEVRSRLEKCCRGHWRSFCNAYIRERIKGQLLRSSVPKSRNIPVLSEQKGGCACVQSVSLVCSRHLFSLLSEICLCYTNMSPLTEEDWMHPHPQFRLLLYPC
jgi:hypothetical protein